MRNPWGTTGYSSAWSKDDAKWNTQTNIDQVPNNVNPKTDYVSGYFVVPMNLFVTGSDACFYDYQIAHYRKAEGYKDARYDKDGADEEMTMYSITVPAKSGDLYFSVESYYLNMIPSVCTTGQYTYTENGVQKTSTQTKPLLYFALYNAQDTNTVIQYKYYI
jgi:hypothetical protein